MNKQQLASKIWESANKLRSKIEANEYKDYILGFIFYKFLSDKEEQFLRKDGWGDEDLEELSEEDTETVSYCRRQLGYFISYDNLFSTWLSKGKDFDVVLSHTAPKKYEPVEYFLPGFDQTKVDKTMDLKKLYDVFYFPNLNNFPLFL